MENSLPKIQSPKGGWSFDSIKQAIEEYGVTCITGLEKLSSSAACYVRSHRECMALFKTYRGLTYMKDGWTEENLSNIIQQNGVTNMHQLKAVSWSAYNFILKHPEMRKLFPEIKYKGKDGDFNRADIIEAAKRCTYLCELKHIFGSNIYNVLKIENINPFKDLNLIDGHHRDKIECSEEDALEIALRCSTLAELYKKSRPAYNRLKRVGKLEYVRQEISKRKKPGYWDNKENCARAARACSTATELGKRFSSAIQAMNRHGWYDELCSHFPDVHYWTKDEAVGIAMGYSDFTTFRKEQYGCFQFLEKCGLKEEATKHMKRHGNKVSRCIYVAEFEDNHAYIGLTQNSDYRWSQHERDVKSAVYKHIETSGLKPVWKVLEDYMPAMKARREEMRYIELYRNTGWTVLNTKAGGGLGGTRFAELTQNDFMQKAKEYESFSAFRKNNNGMYMKLLKHHKDWLEDVKNLFPDTRSKDWSLKSIESRKTKYTKEQCKEISEGLTRSEFKKKNNKAYRTAIKNGWMDELIPESKRNW